MRIFWRSALGLTLLACGSRDDCRDCAITATPIASFGASDGDGALASYPKVGPELDGMRIVLQPDASGELPRQFTTRGRFVRTLGRIGDGPGEFRSVAHAMRSGDSLFLFDTGARRLVVMQSPDRVVRTTAWMSHTNSAVELADGTIVSTDAVWLPGQPFEHLTRGGELLSRFGDSLPAHTRARILAAGASGSFWAAPRTRRLEFEQWASPSRRIKRFEIVSPHYQPYETYVMAGPERAPSPSLRGFWADSLEHLWLMIEVPDKQWRSGYGEPRRGEGGFEYLPLKDWESAWATIIMEFDPNSNRIVRERRFDEAFVQVVGPGLVTRLVQDEDGWYRAQLYRIAPGTRD